MKRLKRRAAGGLAALLALSSAFSSAAVQGSAGEKAQDMVSVTVENTPGGVLMVSFTPYSEDDEESSMYLPIGKEIKLPKGTALTIETDENDQYDDNTSTFLLNYVINGKKIRYDNFEGSDVTDDEGMIVLNDDMTIGAEFIRTDDEDNPNKWDPEEAEDADPNKQQNLKFLNEKNKGVPQKILPKGTEEGIVEQLYTGVNSSRVTKKVRGNFIFGKYRKGETEEYIVKYDLNHPFGSGGEKLAKNDDGSYGEEKIKANIDQNGILTVSGLSDGYVYDLRPVQAIEKWGEIQYKYAGSLKIVCADLTSSNYPLAKLESGLATAYEGGSYFYKEDETVGEILENDPNVVCGVTASKQWTDADGNDITNTLAKDLKNDRRRTDAYAVYEDYDVPTVEKPDLTEMAYINTDDDLHYTFADGTPVTDAFIENESNSDWIYLDSAGEPVSERLVKADKDTPWYVLVDFGTSQETSGAYLETKLEEGGVYYLNDPRKGVNTLERNGWKEIQPDEIQADGAKLPAWYYFGGDGRAVSGNVKIEGVSYTFDDDYRCVLPGWNESLAVNKGANGEAEFEAGELYFAGEDFKKVGTAFAAGDEIFGEAGEYYYLKKGILDADETEGIHEVTVTGKAKLYEATPSEADPDYGMPAFWKVTESTMPGHADSAAGAKNYYLIDADGRMLRNTWNEDENGKKYYGADGMAYRDKTVLIDGESYTFDKKGYVKEEEDETEWDTLQDVAKYLADKLKKLQVDEEEANTEEEAGEFVHSYINEYAGLPAGIEVASVSTAKRSGAFLAAKDGKDGYWYYDVTLADDNEEIATNSSASRRSADAVEIATGSTAGRKSVTIKDNKLIIDAKTSEKPEPEPSADFERAVKQISLLLRGTTLKQADGDDWQAYVDLVEDIVRNEKLPDGITAEVSARRDGYIAPKAGNSANPQGDPGTLPIVVILTDDNGFTEKVPEDVDILPTPYEGNSEEIFNLAEKTLNGLKLSQITDGTSEDYKLAIQSAVAEAVSGNRVLVTVDDFKAPSAGTKNDPDGTNGTIHVSVLVMDKNGNEKTIEKTLTIYATAFEEPENPEKPGP